MKKTVVMSASFTIEVGRDIQILITLKISNQKEAKIFKRHL